MLYADECLNRCVLTSDTAAAAGVPCITPTLYHGSVSGSGGPYPGTPASFECDDGYYLVGDSSTQCQTNGSYSPSPTCSQCGKVDHCNTSVCRSSTDHHCKSASDCDAGYTSDSHCKGVCWQLQLFSP